MRNKNPCHAGLDPASMAVVVPTPTIASAETPDAIRGRNDTP
jgi:hypothetical protein